MELRTRQFDLYPSSETKHKVIVYNKVLARRVNKVTGCYEDAVFKDQDEPLFVFLNDQLPEVLKALKVKNVNR